MKYLKKLKKKKQIQSKKSYLSIEIKKKKSIYAGKIIKIGSTHSVMHWLNAIRFRRCEWHFTIEWCLEYSIELYYLDADSWLRTDFSNIGKLRKYAGRLGNISLGAVTSISKWFKRLSKNLCVSRAKMHGS